MNPRLVARCFAAMLLAALNVPPADAAGDLLEPEQAFRFSTQLIDPELIEVHYRIADGYYMYRDKFRFTADPVSVALGAPQLPPGEVKEDEFFGRVETYRGDLTIRIPVRMPAGSEGFTLKALSQGCADIGVCYTPLTQTAKLIPVAVAVAGDGMNSSGKPSGLLARLKGMAGRFGGEEEFLPVDKAFVLKVLVQDAHTVVARFKPADTYYLYRDKIRFSIEPQAKVAIESVQLPRGEMKLDPNFGDTEVFHGPFQAALRFKRQSSNEATRFTLTASYQGCSEKGLCYAPVSKSFPIVLAAVAAESALVSPVAELANSEPEPLPALQSEDSRIADLLKGGDFWLIVASFLGFGLLLSFTPCVFPMIPILSGIIAGHGHHVTRVRGLLLSAAYVLGMAITYAIAGVAAGLSGTMLSATLQNPWVLGTFAGVFVLLAMSMFGFYELQLPSVLQTRVAGAANHLKGGRLAGVFMMGVLSAVIVGPCVAAPLAGALLYIGQSRDVVLGGSALFAMALGMGVPLLVVGVSAGALLPKAGAWMQTVKNFFGVVLIGAAIWMISPVIPPVVHMLLWAALLIVSAIYLHAIDLLPPDAGGLRKLWKGVGVIALLLGVALLAGALSGGRDILQPLSGLRPTAAIGESAHTPFARVKSIAELDAMVAVAGRPVMLDFYADWCVSCKEMERFTFSDERVKSRLRKMLLLQADVTANSAEDKALLKRFELYGPPGIIFFDRRGSELKNLRTVGYQSADRFISTLDAVLAP